MASREVAQGKVRYRLEGLLWLLRPTVNSDGALYGAAGWLASRPVDGGNLLRFAVAIALMIVLRGAGHTMNDVLDAPRDVVTAPAMPIPSGAVSRRAASVYAVALVALTCGGLVWVASSSVDATLAVLCVFGAYASGGLYSLVKQYGLIASVLVSVQYSAPALIIWVVAGHSHPWVFLLLFVALTLTGIRGNLIAGIRDIDSDHLVGNRTTSTRMGIRRAFNAIIGICFLIIVMLAVIALSPEGSRWGLVWLGAAAVGVGLGAARMRARFTPGAPRDRYRRSRDLLALAYYTYLVNTAFMAVFDPLVALALAVGHRAFNEIVHPFYERRIDRGGLRDSLTLRA